MLPFASRLRPCVLDSLIDPVESTEATPLSMRTRPSEESATTRAPEGRTLTLVGEANAVPVAFTTLATPVTLYSTMRLFPVSAMNRSPAESTPIPAGALSGDPPNVVVDETYTVFCEYAALYSRAWTMRLLPVSAIYRLE